MLVVATAGHVDHGKSTLVRALTGTDPDRLAAEAQRGLTIELGYATAELPGGHRVGIVDVPGHRRFVPTMLAGVGPVPAVLLVVAADDGWMPQTSEHLAALTGFGVDRGILVITRTDLLEPEYAEAEARAELAGTALADIPAVAVSATTGAGMDRLRAELAALAAAAPPADPHADVRLWVDRVFTAPGAGTVVTGTLPAGRLSRGDRLQVDADGAVVTVRGLQTFGEPADRVDAVARVAVNLRGIDTDGLGRGAALTTPGVWPEAREIDVRQSPAAPVEDSLPGPQVTVHVGAAAVPARLRPLGPAHARLRLARALPLRPGDRVLVRDPGSRRILGAVVLDPAPPALTRRGDARRRAEVLAAITPGPDGAGELARRTAAPVDLLRRLGAAVPAAAPVRAGWALDPAVVPELATRLAAAVADHHERDPLDAGLSVEAARQVLGLPVAGLVEAVLADPAADSVIAAGGRLTPAGSARVPAALRPALDHLQARLAAAPFVAPTTAELAALELGRAELAALVRAGELTAIGPELWLGPDALGRAAAALQDLEPPFTVSAARQVWGTSRRVAVPLLEALAAAGLTVVDDAGLHRLR